MNGHAERVREGGINLLREISGEGEEGEREEVFTL